MGRAGPTCHVPCPALPCPDGRAQLLSGNRLASSRFRCLHPLNASPTRLFSAQQHPHPGTRTPELRMGPWTLRPEKKADHPLRVAAPRPHPANTGSAAQAQDTDAPPDQAACGLVVTLTRNLGPGPTLQDSVKEMLSPPLRREILGLRACAGRLCAAGWRPRAWLCPPSRCPQKPLPTLVGPSCSGPPPPLFLAKSPGDTAQPELRRESVLQERGRVSAAWAPPASQPPTSGGISYWSAVKNVPASGSR